jgi:hypothetical protein
MNKLDSQPVSLTLSPPSHSSLERSQRLIVLIPYLEADLTIAAQRIWELANAMGAHVLFLGLYTEIVQELSLRRQLVNLSAIVRSGGISTEIEVVLGRDWVETLRQRLQADDTVVCFANQRFGPSNTPLSHVLQSNLPAPVYILSGLDAQFHPRSQWLAQIAVWTGSIAIMVGFFLLQVKMDHLAKDWAHNLLLMLSIPIEIWFVWIWNSLFE